MNTTEVVILENGNIRLFPNPVEDELTMSIQMPIQGLSYRIFDAGGRQLKTEIITSENTIIKMQNFPSGFYIINLIQSGNQIQSFIIVKQ